MGEIPSEPKGLSVRVPRQPWTANQRSMEMAVDVFETAIAFVFVQNSRYLLEILASVPDAKPGAEFGPVLSAICA